MDKITFGIICSDLEYQDALVKEMSRQDSGLKIKVIDTIKEAQNYSEIILVEEKFIDEHPSEAFDFKDNKVVVLLERGKNSRYPENYQISKYSGAKDILDKIKEIYFLETGKNQSIFKCEKTKLLSFCSDKGGVGVTSSALETARQLARYEGKKVVYINAESVDTSRNYVPLDEGADIRKLFLKMELKDRNKFDYPLESYLIEYEKVFHIKNQSPYNYLGINPKLLKKILEVMHHQQIFDYIIVDFGNELKKDFTDIINQSHIIFFIQKERDVKSILSEILMENLDKNKIKIFSVSKKFFVNERDQRDSKKLIKIDPLSPFANEIKKVVNLIISKERIE